MTMIAIEGCDGHYGVTDDGRVWSYITNRFLKPGISVGYPFVNLQMGPRVKSVKVHRLVATAFVPNPHSLKHVNHKNGDKQNNHAYNLEWCSRAHNLQHAWDTGLRTVTPRLIAAARATGRNNRST